ncbi:MAG: 30S ribosome-binding factor RbfA [Planctomycetota bacterium]|nr:30S ribosome-binding factor RbfA [Planctomycetota bacterium]MDP6838900.1 30S ribosome-binding factor RbfA [Planctomycetota bacterium]MDP6955026.1 30S ribosome-binding factor RbfA [Planctomycetota bacterium]
MANRRTVERLQSRIKERVAYCIQFELADPRSAFVTVLAVELSSDLRNVKISYSVLGDEADRTKVAHMLEHAGGFIQRQMGRVLDTRHVPHIRWAYDDSSEYSDRMDKLIRQARDKDDEIRQRSEPEDTP